VECSQGYQVAEVLGFLVAFVVVGDKSKLLNDSFQQISEINTAL
jgi:hypothetical protein